MTMDSRTQFLLQLLHKLGAPLMRAVSSQSLPDDSSGQKEAQAMASMLSESVKISIALSQAMNIKPEDGNADAIRVSLAALAGGLIADMYKQNGRIPGEAEERRITKALESVIVFADNFAPAAEHTQRLQTLDNAPPFFDAAQASIYSIHALLPAISAIAEFPFGQSETRLIQEVSERLGARSKELASKFGAPENKMSELIILQALGEIYAGAHRAQTKKLSGSGDNAAASMDPVWTSFEKQLAMLEVLLGSMGGNANQASAGSSGGVSPDVAPVAAPPPPVQAAPPPAAPPAGGNPMSFFKKK